MARLFADENFPDPTVGDLRKLGHDVLTVRDIGRSGQAWPDLAVLEFARSEGRALLTLNRRDFFRLHEANPEHAGLVLCRSDLDFPGQAQRIHQAVTQAGDLIGQILRVNRSPT